MDVEDGDKSAFALLTGETIDVTIRRHLVPPPPREEGFFLIKEGRNRYTTKERVRRKNGKIGTARIGLPGLKKQKVMKFFLHQEFAKRYPKRERFGIDFDKLIRSLLELDY